MNRAHARIEQQTYLTKRTLVPIELKHLKSPQLDPFLFVVQQCVCVQVSLPTLQLYSLFPIQNRKCLRPQNTLHMVSGTPNTLHLGFNYIKCIEPLLKHTGDSPSAIFPLTFMKLRQKEKSKFSKKLIVKLIHQMKSFQEVYFLKHL